MSKPNIRDLLIDSALQPEVRRRLAEAPDELFEEYKLTAEERDLLRNPDHRLLPLLGAALARGEAPETAVEEISVATSDNRMLADSLMALTVVPCVVQDRIAFAAWIAPMHPGADPSRFPLPAGAALPGQPLAPLHAVIQLSSAQSADAAGNLQVNVWASFRQSSNAVTPAPPETAGNPEASPFGSPLDSADVRTAVAAVRASASADRYEKLAALVRALHGGEVR